MFLNVMSSKFVFSSWIIGLIVHTTRQQVLKIGTNKSRRTETLLSLLNEDNNNIQTLYLNGAEWE